jgi:3-hydroxymyristoyl/3-hydroxydecanoyl-(acyl carrier protein) dehydratase
MSAAFAAPLVAADTVTADTVIAESGASGVSIQARKWVDPGETYLRGHFPGFVIYPGVFLIETFTQAVALGFGQLGMPAPRLAELTSVRFVAPVLAGEELTMQVVAPVPVAGIRFTVRATAHRADGSVAARLSGEFDVGGSDA